MVYVYQEFIRLISPGRGARRGLTAHVDHINSRGPPLPKRVYEISNLPKDFKISAKISDFS